MVVFDSFLLPVSFLMCRILKRIILWASLHNAVSPGHDKYPRDRLRVTVLALPFVMF